MNTKKRQRHYLTIKQFAFTLVETLIVLTIVAIVASVVTINAKSALRNERFQSEVVEFVELLKLAQDLMLIANADVHVKIQADEKEKAIKYWIETDKPLLKSFDSLIKKTRFLKTVHHVAYSPSKEGLIDLKFLSNGSVMSSGNIQLSSKLPNDDSSLLIANIMLKGSPSPIFSTKKLLNEESADFMNKDAALIQMTIQEIQMIQNENN